MLAAEPLITRLTCSPLSPSANATVSRKLAISRPVSPSFVYRAAGSQTDRTDHRRRLFRIVDEQQHNPDPDDKDDHQQDYYQAVMEPQAVEKAV